ncbi:MAG: glycosyltransferase family 4 protein [Brevundimonas sp.]|nr:glycosyltransferase family 4 protein [Brevundimonas sp.]
MGSSRGFAQGLFRTFEILKAATSLRRRIGINQVIVRAPEHANFLLLPMLEMVGFNIVIWLVADRCRISEVQRRRQGILAKLALFASALTGHVEGRFLRRHPVVANGKDLVERYCRGNDRAIAIYSSLISGREFNEISEASQSRTRQHGIIRLLYVGRIAPEKGINRLFDFLQAMEKTAARRNLVCHLTLVGKIDRSELKLVESMIAHSVRSITFAGFIRRGQDLWREFASADFLCLLSEAEGTPRIVPEAFAAGLPVLISREANADDIVPERAMMLQDGKYEALAENAVELFCDIARYKSYAEVVRARGRQYLVDAVIERFSNVTTTTRAG